MKRFLAMMAVINVASIGFVAAPLVVGGVTMGVNSSYEYESNDPGEYESSENATMAPTNVSSPEYEAENVSSTRGPASFPEYETVDSDSPSIASEYESDDTPTVPSSEYESDNTDSSSSLSGSKLAAAIAVPVTLVVVVLLVGLIFAIRKRHKANTFVIEELAQDRDSTADDPTQVNKELGKVPENDEALALS